MKKIFERLDDWLTFTPIVSKVYIPLWRAVSTTRTEIRRFPSKLKRAIKWFFRMYNNEEWDFYFYGLDVIEYKLKDTRKYLSKSEWNHIHTKRDILLLDICLHSLNIYRRECYDFNVMKLFRKKFGYATFDSGDIAFDKCKTKEESDYADRVWERLMRILTKEREKHKKRFFYVLEKYHERWWD